MPEPADTRRPAETPLNPDEVAIGRVVGVFGIRGEVKLEPYADSPARYTTLKHATAVWPNGNRRPLDVAGARKHKTHILMRFAGLDTPNEAETLRGVTLVVPLSERAPLPPGQYYVADLVGLTVITTSGETIGPITDVLHTKAHDVYVTDRGMIPAVKQYVKAVDMEKRRVVVAAAEGLFDGP